MFSFFFYAMVRKQEVKGGRREKAYIVVDAKSRRINLRAPMTRPAADQRAFKSRDWIAPTMYSRILSGTFDYSTTNLIQFAKQGVMMIQLY